MKLIIGSALLVSSVLGAGYGYGSYQAPKINAGYKPIVHKSQDSASSESTKRDSSRSERSTRKSESESESTEYESSHGYCKENEIPVTNSPGLCECDYTRGFAKLDGENCIRCPKNGHWEPSEHYGKGGCVCDFSFTWVKGECVKRYH